MSTHSIEVDTEVKIEIRDGVDWLWYSDAHTEKPEWRGDVYGLETEERILAHFAYNAVANGVEDATRLDGWADLERGDIMFTVLAEVSA